MYVLTFLGITAGVHRLWTHKTYKAKMPLQICLMLCHSASNTNTSIKWIRDHTLHHKSSMPTLCCGFSK
ncbi:Fatty-acyl-CoA desaturase, partial [Operophtera brumata]